MSKLEQAALRLAGMIPNGNLLAVTDMTAFLTAVADKIDALTRRCGELMRGQDAQSETIAHLESQLHEATKAGTPYAADRDAMNSLVMENQRLEAMVDRMLLAYRRSPLSETHRAEFEAAEKASNP